MAVTSQGKGKAKKPAKPARKQPERTKRAPKAAPVSKVKAKKPREALTGPAPLSIEDFSFCREFVQTGKQVTAYRYVWPDKKDPHGGAFRMMERPEIRAHIRAIFAEISKRRSRAATIAAESSLLSLEVADSRLNEILNAKRRTRGEMFSRDVKVMLTPAGLREDSLPMMPPLPGETVEDAAERMAYNEVSAESNRAVAGMRTDNWLQEAAPADDADLLKAIKLTYERKQGIIKAEKAPEAALIGVMLYKPQWFGQARKAPELIEGA